MNIQMLKGTYLGSGLIGIGRTWGHMQSSVPQDSEVIHFLSFAAKLGIFYFDTAAAYGSSEERLGKFLPTLTTSKRNKLIVATKFGEQWNAEKNEAFVDHSYQSLKKSLDRSLGILKKIDVLYLHKAHMQALPSNDLAKAFDYAKSLGITSFGASVSDLESAQYVLKSNFYSVIQLPYNMEKTLFGDVIDEATKKGKIVVINRPFNMGAMLYQNNNEKIPQFKIDAYKFIMKKKFNGFILTGTKSPEHLRENYDAFTNAKIS